MVNILPTMYNKTAPNTEPNVADRATFHTFIPLNVVKNPPNAKITSDGIGGKIFSIVINKKMPIYPNSLIISNMRSSIAGNTSAFQTSNDNPNYIISFIFNHVRHYSKKHTKANRFPNGSVSLSFPQGIPFNVNIWRNIKRA